MRVVAKSGLAIDTWRLGLPVLMFVVVLLAAAGVASGQTSVTVSGTITDNSGAAVAGVTVTAGQGGSAVASTASQLDGTYSLTLEAGTYDLAFSGADGLQDVSLADQDLSADRILDVVLVPIEPEPVQVSGTVRDSSGDPVAGAVISIGGQQAPVANNGTYALTILPGTQSAVIDFPCSIFYAPIEDCATQTWPDGGDFFNLTVRNVEIDGPTSDLDFTLPDRTVSVTVIDESGDPVPDARVALNGTVRFLNPGGNYTDGEYRARAQTTAADGTASLTGFVDTDTMTARLEVSKAGFETVTERFNITDDQALTVTLPPAPQPVSVSGTILDSSGDPVAGALITIGDEGTTVGPDGTYSLIVLTGTHRASLDYVCPTGDCPAQTWPPGGNFYFRLLNVDIDGPTTDLDYTLEDRTVTVTVVDENGDPLEDARVTLAGEARFGPVRGDYSATTTMTGGDGVAVMTGFANPDEDVTSMNISKAGYETVSLRPTIVDDQAIAVTLSLIPEPVEVSGTVRDSGGDPVPGAVINIGGQVTPVGADGSYILTVLPGTQGAALDFPCRVFHSPIEECPSVVWPQGGDFNFSIRNVDITGPASDVDITIEDRALNLTIVDESSDPVPDAQITLTGSADFGTGWGDYHGTTTTGADGTATITGFVNPDEANAILTIRKSGFETVTLRPTITDDQDILIVFLDVPEFVFPVSSGETVTSDDEADGPTPDEPLEVSLTSPEAGDVELTRGPVEPFDVVGFELLDNQVEIVAPEATADEPLMFVFELDATVLPPGGAAAVTVFRNTVAVSECTTSDGTATPDPCVADRSTDGNGDAAITVLSSRASVWAFGIESNAAPEITTGGGRDPIEVSVEENTSSVVIDIDATDDADREDGGLVYELTASADRDDLDIDASNGQVTFVASPDHESPMDADTDNLYLVAVRVTDQEGLSDAVELQVTVTNVNEAPTPADDEFTTEAGQDLFLSAAEILANDSDPDGDALLITGNTTPPPTEGSIVGSNSSGLTFVPAPGFIGRTTFRYFVNDGELFTGAEIAVVVTEPNNIPPTVEAGPGATIPALSDLLLTGSVTDDGALQPIVTAWSVVSGPGNATFGDASALESEVLFDTPGVYELQLSASDGEFTVTDTVTITVDPPAGGPFSTNVSVAVRGGSLVVTGDNADNLLTVCMNVPGTFTVKIFGDGVTLSEIRTGVIRDIRINTRSGNDRVLIGGGCETRITIGRDLTVNLGAGDDELSLRQTDIGDDLTAVGSSGEERVDIDDVVVDDRVSINTSSGPGNIGISSSDFGRTTLRTGSANDEISITGSDLGSRPAIFTLNGDDSLAVLSTVATGRVTISTGNGADHVAWDDGTGATPGTRGGAYFFNGIFGGQDDDINFADALVPADRLNGGAGAGDRLGLTGTGGGARINGFELFGPPLLP